jgi:putative ABC transport system permease protein
MLQDLGLAVRTLRKSPTYTFVAVLALALGIGANVAIFSAVYAVLLAPLPYPEPSELVVPISVNRERGFDRVNVSFADFQDYRAMRGVFAGMSLVQPFGADLTGTGEPERVEAVRITSDFFTVLGTRPLAGRLLTAADFEPAATPVAVISEGFWRRRLGADVSFSARELRLGGRPIAVVGILADEAVYPANTDVWIPLDAAALGEDERTRRDNFIFEAIARLAPGASLDQARARMRTVAARVAREFPESRRHWDADVVPLRQYIVEQDLRRALLVLLAGVGAVLLIVCVNVANLLLARGTARAREMSIRLALGARRSQLVRQLVLENGLLGTAGGAAGVIIAYWMIHALVLVAPEGVPFLDRISLDSAALVAATAVTLVCVLGFGVVPAITASRARPVDALRETSGVGGGRAARVRDVLVVAQIAVASVLLITAGLLIRSFVTLANVDPGADVERVLGGRISVPAARYRTPDDRARFVQTLLDNLAARPGVAAAAATSYLPVGGPGFGLGRVFLPEGRPEPPAATDVDAAWNVVTPDYFRTVGIPLLQGRVFDDRDASSATPVIIISRTFARRMFGDDNPLGRRIRSWRDENLLREIVGVVADVRYGGLGDDESSLVYVPHAQQGWGGMVIAVRTTSGSDPAALGSVLRQEVARLDPEIAVATVGTMAQFASASIARERFSTMLLSAFAVTAVTLAAIGIYGVMAYAVGRKTRELGVRSAMGATPRQLASAVLGRALWLSAVGAAIGVVAGSLTAQALEELLFGVTATDAVTFAAAPLLLAFIAVAACYAPARRASRVDPVVALRIE